MIISKWIMRMFLLKGANVGSSSSLKLVHYVNHPHTVVM